MSTVELPVKKKSTNKTEPKKRVNEFKLEEVESAFKRLQVAYAEVSSRVEMLKSLGVEEVQLDGEQNPLLRSAVILSRLAGNLRRAYEKELEG